MRKVDSEPVEVGIFTVIRGKPAVVGGRVLHRELLSPLVPFVMAPVFTLFPWLRVRSHSVQ